MFWLGDPILSASLNPSEVAPQRRPIGPRLQLAPEFRALRSPAPNFPLRRSRPPGRQRPLTRGWHWINFPTRTARQKRRGKRESQEYRDDPREIAHDF